MTKLASYAYPFPGYSYQSMNATPSRAVSSKRLNGVRLNWFVMGALAGVALTSLLNTGVQHTIELAMQASEKSSTPIVEQITVTADAEPTPQVKDEAPSLELLSSLFDNPPVAVPDPATKLAHKGSIDEIAEPEAVGPAMPDYPKTIEHTMKKGDTLMNILVAQDIGYLDADEAVKALKKSYNPRNLRPGQDIIFSVEPSAENPEKMILADMRIDLSRTEHVTLSKADKGYLSKKLEKKLTTEVVLAGGTITNSLFETGYANGVPDGVLAELVNAYSYDVDFQREIQRGDQMEVLFEKKLNEDGETAGHGEILFAMLKLRGKPLNIYHYEDKDGNVGFYNEKGESVVKALLKTPVKAARISSGYGMRRHPILGYNKMHKGTDFAAPTGTPIYAAGDGKVEFVGRKGGYGKYIKIKHNGTYSTAYAHMHRYGKGMKRGKKVKQGQIIGYVGSTGRSTGPHLHYEVHKHGRQVNPMKERFKTGKELKGTELANFKKSMTKIKQQVASMPRAKTTVASSR